MYKRNCTKSRKKLEMVYLCGVPVAPVGAVARIRPRVDASVAPYKLASSLSK